MDFSTDYDFDVLARHRQEIREEVARALLASEIRREARAVAKERRRFESARGWLGRGWRREPTA